MCEWMDGLREITVYGEAEGRELGTWNVVKESEWRREDEDEWRGIEGLKEC